MMDWLMAEVRFALAYLSIIMLAGEYILLGWIRWGLTDGVN